ncbi:DUF917 domain-containing protein [Clostridium sp. DJ247]|nr:DUF917 domain-containing protein [Clostridium sp. DJ247]
MEDVKAAVRGGSVFASGGGGWVDHGLEIGETAIRIGRVRLVSVEELPEDAIIITASAIGAPAAKDWQMLAADYIKSAKLLQEHYDKKIVGIMTPQNGCSSSINGWVHAAALDLVVVDAVGDMRAHPTGKMGCMGLASDIEYETIQVVVGGKRETGSHLEVIAKGSVAKTANILRKASEQSGSFIACARNPLPASFIKNNAALGGISRAIELGKNMIAAEKNGGQAVIEAICNTTNGEIIGTGIVESMDFVTAGGYDIGKCIIDTGDKKLTLHIMNEYMAVEDNEGNRLTTYPDVITTLSVETGLPVSVAYVKKGMKISVLSINKKNIPLSTGVKDPAVYPEVEEALGIDIASYALEK